MARKKPKKSDYEFGVDCEVKKNTVYSSRVGFSSSLFEVGETVYIFSKSERDDLFKQIKNNDSIANEDFESQIKEKDESISKLNDQIASLQSELASSKSQIKKQLATSKSQIKEKDDCISKLKERIDSLSVELEEPVVKADDEKQTSYWKNAYEEMIKSSDELAARNEELVKENERLKTTNDNINETNKLLNDNMLGMNDNYQESQKELQAVYEGKQKELNKTIEKQQTHIDDLTKKVESLAILKEYIPPKKHYEELSSLKDKIKEVELELDKATSKVDAELSSQKSELQIAHTEEKAQMLLAYNQELNSYKLKFNELAKDYNHLLEDVNSLSRANTFFSGKHKAIVKDKEPVDFEEIDVEKPTKTIEYVPKDEVS